jgi:hypothetical protein
VRVGQKQVHDRSSLLFQGDGDGLAGEAAMEVGGPDRDGFGCVVHDALLWLAAAGGLENPSMFLATPVEADERGPGWLWGGNNGIRHVPNSFPEGLAWFRRKSYSRVQERKASEYSFLEPSASRRSNGSAKASDCRAQKFVATGCPLQQK